MGQLAYLILRENGKVPCTPCLSLPCPAMTRQPATVLCDRENEHFRGDLEAPPPPWEGTISSLG